jgi:hypothetical protein
LPATRSQRASRIEGSPQNYGSRSILPIVIREIAPQRGVFALQGLHGPANPRQPCLRRGEFRADLGAGREVAGKFEVPLYVGGPGPREIAFGRAQPGCSQAFRIGRPRGLEFPGGSCQAIIRRPRRPAAGKNRPERENRDHDMDFFSPWCHNFSGFAGELPSRRIVLIVADDLQRLRARWRRIEQGA